MSTPTTPSPAGGPTPAETADTPLATGTATASVASGLASRRSERVAATLLPVPRRTIPAATARRYRGWLAAWAAAAVVCAVALVAAAPLALQAASLGMLLPGGGLLAAGHGLLALGAVALFALAVFVWWFIGVIVLPPLVWIGAAVWAAALVDRPLDGAGEVVAFAALPTVVALAYATHRVRHARQLRVGLAINERLAGVTFPISGGDLASRPSLVELSAEDLEFQRYAFDLALQPLDRFDGFSHFDQFREGALRYQLFFLGYALSLSQSGSTPAFSGYLAEAQQNAIEKVLDRRVWGYWALENAWGRLSLRKDPVDTVGNVMLTGYYGTQIGMYESFGDRRYSEPGALSFRWSNSHRFAHDYGSVAESVMSNVEGNDYALFACEPNWIYSMCNAFGLTTLVTHDRLHGTDFMARGGEQMRRSLETEFLRPDGRVIGMRSKHLGLTWNLFTGVPVQLTTALWLHPSLPDLAQRAWWLLRPDLQIQDGLLNLPPSLSTTLDPGNYGLGTNHYAMSITEVAAREMGDDEIAAAARRTLDATSTVTRQGGAAKYEGMSPFTSMYSLMARTMRAGSLRDLVAFDPPEAWLTGPRLSGAAYPEVLVARAGTDGRALDLVLQPGAGAARTCLHIDRLVPHAEYRVDGAHPGDATVIADAAGRATVTVDLGGRTEVFIRPI